MYKRWFYVKETYSFVILWTFTTWALFLQKSRHGFRWWFLDWRSVWERWLWTGQYQHSCWTLLGWELSLVSWPPDLLTSWPRPIQYFLCSSWTLAQYKFPQGAWQDHEGAETDHRDVTRSRLSLEDVMWCTRPPKVHHMGSMGTVDFQPAADVAVLYMVSRSSAIFALVGQ